jgi:succinate-acetate transporter protein
LAGFGITTLLLQFHNVGWCGVGPIVSMAFIFGGLAQMIAGYQVGGIHVAQARQNHTR